MEAKKRRTEDRKRKGKRYEEGIDQHFDKGGGGGVRGAGQSCHSSNTAQYRLGRYCFDGKKEDKCRDRQLREQHTKLEQKWH